MELNLCVFYRHSRQFHIDCIRLYLHIRVELTCSLAGYVHVVAVGLTMTSWVLTCLLWELRPSRYACRGPDAAA